MAQSAAAVGSDVPPSCHDDGSGDGEGDCGGDLPRSNSMDSMLGDSLLDPPQSLKKIPPKRYQSPSRCGSPSLEAPEHLLFGSKRDQRYGEYRVLFQPFYAILFTHHRSWLPFSINILFSDPSYRHAPSLKSSNERCARQDLIRRRDMNLYYGLHPRLLHSAATHDENSGNAPRLSLPLKSCFQSNSVSSSIGTVGPLRPVRIASPAESPRDARVRKLSVRFYDFLT